MQLAFTTLDVFTKTRFQGNPLAVVRVPSTLRDRLTEEQKLKIVQEFNLSETTFLHDVQPGQDYADYDIFTTRGRISFAGHPTIGTSIYAAQHAEDYEHVKKIKTIAGTIPFVYDASTGISEVSIPHDVRTHQKRLPHPFPGEATNPTTSDTVPIFSIVKGMAFILIQLATLEALGNVNEGVVPRAEIMKSHLLLDQGSGWDIGFSGSFYFCDLGVDPEDEKRRLIRTRMISDEEDSGTGSASCALGAYLALREGSEKGEHAFAFHFVQGVEMGKRCDIFVDVRRKADGSGIEEIKMRGSAVKVMEGVVFVDEEGDV